MVKPVLAVAGYWTGAALITLGLIQSNWVAWLGLTLLAMSCAFWAHLKVCIEAEIEKKGTTSGF